jgi:hypothetical protein
VRKIKGCRDYRQRGCCPSRATIRGVELEEDRKAIVGENSSFYVRFKLF